MSRFDIRPRRRDRSPRRDRSSRRFQLELLEPRALLAGNLATHTYTVLNTNDSGPDSLRDAITWANANPNPSTATQDSIRFAINGVGQQTITVLSPLPTVTVSLLIDGYSQAGSSTNYSPASTDDQETDLAVLTVRIDGASAGAGANGLTIAALNCTVDGLSITRFGGAGIMLNPGPTSDTGAVGTILWGNFIGVTSFNPANFNHVPLGANPLANGVGVAISSSNNRIGGTLPPDRNVIQGNAGDGLTDSGPSGTGNLIEANFILDNAGNGVHITTSNNFVGEAIGLGPAGGGNVISGNGANGVLLSGPAASGNVVVNNEIGTEIGIAGAIPPIRGMNPRPNVHDGVLIEDAPGNIIGGTLPNSFNVIASNGVDGVGVQNDLTTGATRNQILGNHIGYNLRGNIISILPNRDGVNVSSADNTIGGTVLAAQNIIINNSRNGVTISSSTLDASNVVLGPIPNARPTGNVVEGNFIGTQGGADDYGNTLEGVLINQATGNTIGGTTAGARNVISGNNDGVIIRDPASSGNVVEGDYIGTMSDGVNVLANAFDGVRIDNSPNNTIGGTAAGAANVLSGNNWGVRILGASATGNLVAGNDIGTDNKGTGPVRNSIDGVLIGGGASNNTIGGLVAGAANTIGFNVGSGVNVVSGMGNAVLSNSIFTNKVLGINLTVPGDPSSGVTPNDPVNPDSGPNDRQNYPVLTAAISDGVGTSIQGTFGSTPNTSFLLQFFSNALGNPSNYGEGQSLLGSKTVTTDGSGKAAFVFTFQTVVPANGVIAATATAPNGDTSEFSKDIPSGPVNVQFAAVSATVPNTPGATATIHVTRSGVTTSVATVDYATGGGTAVAGADYTPESGTITFLPGETDHSFTVPILNSGAIGPDTTVNITLVNPTDGATISGTNPFVLTIQNTNAPAFQFSSTTPAVNENAGNAAITVTRNSGIGTATVNFSAGGGSAVPNQDYTPVNGMLTFNPGQTTQTFTVPVFDNTIVDGPLTVDLALSGPTGAVLGAASTATLTIQNTDQAGALAFNTTVYGVSGAANAVVITVNRLGGKGGQVAVNFGTSNGTASAGTDYAATAGTLTFQPNEVSKTFTIPILNNPGASGNTSVNLFLSNPTNGASLGAISTATLLILHNGQYVPPPSGNTNGPTVQDVGLMNNGQAITGIVLSFNEALNAASAQNLSNYGYYLISAGADGVFGSGDDFSTLLQSATYNPATFQVILTPSSPLPLNLFYKVNINEQANPAVGSGLIDAAGNLLANGPYAAIVGLGARFVYNDHSGYLVTIQIAKGGLIELRRGANGDAQQVRVVNGVPRRSVVTGQVKGPRHARGVSTHIGRLISQPGVRVNFRTPPFFFG